MCTYFYVHNLYALCCKFISYFASLVFRYMLSSLLLTIARGPTVHLLGVNIMTGLLLPAFIPLTITVQITSGVDVCYEE